MNNQKVAYIPTNYKKLRLEDHIANNFGLKLPRSRTDGLQSLHLDPLTL